MLYRNRNGGAALIRNLQLLFGIPKWTEFIVPVSPQCGCQFWFGRGNNLCLERICINFYTANVGDLGLGMCNELRGLRQ